MTVLRWFLALVVIFCIAGTFARGIVDGLTIIGAVALILFFWICGVFSRGFWYDARQDEQLARLDAELERRYES